MSDAHRPTRTSRRLMALGLAMTFALGLTVTRPTPTDAASCIYLDDAKFNADGDDLKNLNGEWVQVTNRCSTTTSITGWLLKDRAGTTYRFPSTALARGSLYVHTGKGTNSAAHRYWNRTTEVWDNTASETASLTNLAGSVVSRNPMPCTRTVSGSTAGSIESARNAAGTNGVVCFPARTYTGNVTASVAGQLWRFDPAAQLNGAIRVTGAGVTIHDGTIVRPTGDRWLPSVEVRAHDVTVRSIAFKGGGAGVGIYGKDRTRILSNAFTGLSGSAVSIWSEGVGADQTLIDGNSMVQTITNKVSPIMSRGNESTSHGGVQNTSTVIRKNTIDQGAGDKGWFGIELKQSRGTVIDGNKIKGGHVLVSLPETNSVSIRGNTFDLRGSPHWGVEVAHANDVTVYGNTFIGDGPDGNDYAVATNSNSQRAKVTRNTVREIHTLFQIAGDYHVITDNCFTHVKHATEFPQNGGSHITIARNGSC